MAETNLEASRAVRRVKLLQVIADGLETHLADNLDYLFYPWGHELPDPSSVGERIACQLDVIDRCDEFWNHLGDESSRELFVRFFAYRAIGPAHIRLQLEPGEYRQMVLGLAAQTIQKAMVLNGIVMPMEWQLNRYDYHAHGFPLQVIGSPLPLASTFAFSQYAYRDKNVQARPMPGDTALDIGGCWGDTALWLAHVVGPTGMVHTFEPGSQNRALLHANLDLNPELKPRIQVWNEAVGPSAGEVLWMQDTIAAGLTMESDQDQDPDRPLSSVITESIDNLVAEHYIEHVDFVKVDVEGADLGVLEGAAKTIAEQRPRLALAIYHKPDDLAVIPDFVASLGVEYRWYLQCSTMTDIDTVAFAVPVE